MRDEFSEQQEEGLRRAPHDAGLSRMWKRTGAWAVGVLLLGYLAVGAYSDDGWVFPFSQADLGFHELGHMLTMPWAPQPLVSFAGSLTEVAVPLGLAVYFLWRRSDLFAGALMIAWAGEAANGVSIYIYDATRRVLPLLGSQEGHDWAYLLSPGVWDALEQTDAIAYTVRGLSVLLFVCAFGILAWGFVRPRLEDRSARELAERRATLPVREVVRRTYKE